MKLMVIAGEVSGDMRAAGLVSALKKREPSLECFGIGGDHLESAGMETLHHVRDMAAMGLVEVLPKLFFFRRVFHEMVRLVEERKPDAVLLVDYPGFNMRFAAKMRAMNVKVIYYVCPQVWAWHKSRIPQMARVIDRLMVIFPFEPAVFEGTGLKVEYVGHPLVDEIGDWMKRPVAELPWAGERRIALLPGSRRQEVDRMLPLFCDAAAAVEEEHGDSSFIVAAPTEEIADLCRARADNPGRKPSRLEIVAGKTRDVLRSASAALTASGTATVEAALIGCPMVIAYRMSNLSFMFLKRLVTVDRIGMPNIIMGREVCPEFVQYDATPEALAAAIGSIAFDTAERAQMVRDLGEISERLGPAGSHDRAASIVMSELSR